MSNPLVGMATLTFVVALGAAGCEPSASSTADVTTVSSTASPSSTARPTASSSAPVHEAPTGPAQESATFVAVVDGDTIETSAGTVRLVGIDAPEHGECGYSEASMTIGRLVLPGDAVVLELPVGENDRDQYDRLIRFVTTEAGVDLGLWQLEAGNAIARYDSTDGYLEHPREAECHSAQVADAGPDGSVVTVACQEEAQQSVAPLVDIQATEATAPEDPWWQQYSSCSRLKKNTVGHPKGPFRADDPAEVDIYNWFQFGTGHSGDGDNDGLACE